MAHRWWSIGTVLMLAVGVGLGDGAAAMAGAGPGAGASPAPEASSGPALEPRTGSSGSESMVIPWVGVQLPAGSAAPLPRAITAWQGGFAALDGQRGQAVRISPDGIAWSDLSGVDGMQRGDRIAASGDGLLVVGQRRGDLRAWISDDGRRWRPMDGPPIHEGEAADAILGYAVALVTVGERTLLRWGVECPETTCPEFGPRLSGMSVGGTWETLPPAVDDGPIVGVFPGRARFLATVNRPDATPDALVASVDGRAWSAVAELPAGWANAGVLVGETRGGWVAVLPSLPDSGSDGGAILTSTDGSTWVPAWTSPEVAWLEWSDLDVAGDTISVVGTMAGAGPIAVTSVDGGKTWSASVMGGATIATDCLEDGAVRATTAVAIGVCGLEAGTWVAATIPGVPAAGVGRTLTGPVDPAAVPWRYRCEGSDAVIRALDLADAPDVAVADPQAAAMVARLAERGAVPGDGWRLVAEQVSEVLLARWDPDGRGPVAGLVLFRGAGTEVWRGGATCAVSVDPEAWSRGIPTRLDRSFPRPTARSRVLHLVTRACKGVATRPRVLVLTDAVLLQLPVRERSSCGDVGGRETPVPIRVELPEALGDRSIWNAGRLPFMEIRR